MACRQNLGSTLALRTGCGLRAASRCSPAPACRRRAASRRSAARTACGALPPRGSRHAQAFARDPALLWEWYGWRRETIARCAPNAAHEVLARWSQARRAHDRRHAERGRPAPQGRHRAPRAPARFDLGAVVLDWLREPAAPRGATSVCRCRACRAARTASAPARPAVVWFGEMLAEADLRAAVQATACDVFLTVGTSSRRLSGGRPRGAGAAQRRVHRRDQRRGHAGDGDRRPGDSGAGRAGAAGDRSAAVP